MDEPTETQQSRHPLRAANLHFVLAWMIFNVASTAAAAPPNIDYPPRSQTVILYQQAAFGVIASGNSPLSYQWRKDGVGIVGASIDQVVLRQAQFSDSGLYSVVVSNAEGSVTSADVALIVNSPKGGDLDFSFAWGGSIDGWPESLVVQPNGKILIAGGFSTVPGAVGGGIARLNADGTIDHTFLNGISGTDGSVSSVAMQNDGKLIIVGDFTTVNGVSRTNIARLNADGTLDNSFRDGDGFFKITPTSAIITLQSDGKILVAGHTCNGAPPCYTFDSFFARLNTDGSLDNGFQNGFALSDGGYISALAVRRDGKVLIAGRNRCTGAGEFTSCHPFVAQLNADGTQDSSFQTEVSADGVSAIAVQSDGKVLLGGQFTTVNGMGRTNIARLNADGTLDLGFQIDFKADYVSKIALQKDEKVLLIGGRFAPVSGESRNFIARVNADGTLDSDFGSGGLGVDFYVASITVQADGKILIGGESVSSDNVSHIRVLRLNADGTLDNGFQYPRSESNYHSGANGNVASVAAQSDGKVLIGGSFNRVNGMPAAGIARLNADGTLDSGFQTTGSKAFNPSGVESIALQSDGKMLISGRFIDNISRVARLNADGTLDNGFHNVAVGGIFGGITSVAVQSDGKVLIGGTDGTTPIFGRLSPDGNLDGGFPTKVSLDANGPILATPAVNSIALQSDGKALIGGWFTKVNGVNRTNIARLNADGTMDSGFQPELLGGDGGLEVSSIGLQSDGRVLAGGSLRRLRGVVRSAEIKRLNTDGTLDRGFQTEELLGSSISSLVVQSNGKVLIGGDFTTVNGASRGIARLNADGSSDTSFQSVSGFGVFYRNVNSVAVQSDGKVLIGGAFSIVNGVLAGGIAKLWGSADVPPRIQSLHDNGADMNLTWDALPNRSYRVQYKEIVSVNNWTELDGDISTTTGTASKADTTVGKASQRFYRVVLLP